MGIRQAAIDSLSATNAYVHNFHKLLHGYFYDLSEVLSVQSVVETNQTGNLLNHSNHKNHSSDNFPSGRLLQPPVNTYRKNVLHDTNRPQVKQ